MIYTPYVYKVKEVSKVYDGDTITVIIDLGFNITIKEKIRLTLINAPEVRGIERPQGLKSRDYLREILYNAIKEEKTIIIKTLKDRKGKYGRYLGEIFIDDISINEKLVNDGYAVFAEY